MHDSQRDLLIRASRGEGQAFEALVAPHDRRLLSLALDLVGDADDAQDVFQEAMIAAYRGLGRFRAESDLATWLYRIVANQAMSHRRRRWQQRRLGQAAAEASVPHRAESQDGAVLRAELGDQLTAALASLSRRERAAFALCHRQGLTIARAGEIMGCSSGAVKSYLFRARARMRAALGPYLES